MVSPKTLFGVIFFYQSNYEPGSALKVMTLAAAIDNNTFPGGEYFNSSELKIADATIRDWDVNDGLTTGGMNDFLTRFRSLQ